MRGQEEGGVLVSDFDGTMTRHDFYKLIRAQLLGPEVPDYWEDYRAGRMTHFEALAAFFGAIRARREEVQGIITAMEVEPGICELIDELGVAGWRVVVASAGCGWYIERLLGECLKQVELHANPGQFVEGEGLLMELPRESAVFSPTVGIDKAAVVQSALESGRRVAFAGDGYPDLEAALLVPAGMRFARGDLAGALRDEGAGYVPFGSWAEVARRLMSG